MKNISILGSTGSIGTQTLDVISEHPELFRVVGLSARQNLNLLKEQIEKFRPEVVSVADERLAVELSSMINDHNIEILYGTKGASTVASLGKTDLVVSAMVGASGLEPTLDAVRAGKDIALANKETLVIAGELITSEAQKNGVRLLPVDSEHSALFQALEGNNKKYVKRIILTASGGPFLDYPSDKLDDVTVEVALDHPTWKMGRKITIDSATLMNKGFEVIEAKWFFGIDSEDIHVWIHPQSIVHSMVEFIDGAIISQMSKPDMRIPIAYALSYPQRISVNGINSSPEGFGNLNFREADFDQFPALSLAFEALGQGGTLAAVMNGANEIAVEEFLSGNIKFTDIVSTVEKVMNSHTIQPADSLQSVLDSDAWARQRALSLIRN